MGAVPTTAAPAASAPPFLLTTSQGRAARLLMSYVAALLLSSPEAQLLAVVIVIRSTRGGTGNITGQDLRSLKLTDPARLVAEVRGLGWEIPDQLLDGPPELPVAVTVPDLAAGTDHPLPLGKQARTRVSGWTTRTFAAKPLKKTTPAARLAALFLAAHGSPTLPETLPADFPEACRAALPELLEKNFLAELSGDQYRLDAGVRHLAGMVPGPATPSSSALSSPSRRKPARWTPPPIDPDEWAQWKDRARPGLRRHVEAVESCALCSLPRDHVAAAFMSNHVPIPSPRYVLALYNTWKEKHPARGVLAAQFTVAFRAEHGHGPSQGQLCDGLGWNLFRTLRTLVVGRLLANEWLTDTAPVPWTLRPGATANAHGVMLPGHGPHTAP
ncbi:hypothetical protein ACWGEU_08065 [Streptomyces goshikiensis]